MKPSDPFPAYMTFLEGLLTPARLQHSLGVMQTMEALAGVYNLDLHTARTAGLLHDAAKDLPPERQAAMIDLARIPILEECERSYLFFLHGPVGAFLVERELSIKDPAVLNAISTHTHIPGVGFHAPLAWCLRFSDVLEPYRDWRSVPILSEALPRLKELAFSGRMWEAAELQVSTLIRWFDTAGYPVHPHMRQVARDFAARPGESPL